MKQTKVSPNAFFSQMTDRKVINSAQELKQKFFKATPVH